MPRRSDKMLTERTLKGLRGTGRQYDVPDGLVPGLTVRVGPDGAKHWCLRYRLHGKQERTTFATYPAASLAEARQIAQEARDEVRAGRRPQIAAKASTGDFSSMATAWQAYDKAVLTHLRSAYDRRQAWKRLWEPTIGHMPPASVTRGDLVTALDTLRAAGKSASARNGLRYLTPFLGWLIEREAITSSPAEGIKAPKPNAPRRRVLSLPELHRLWHAAGRLGYPFGPALRLLMLTGQRRDEIGDLDWREVDLAARVLHLPAARTKNAEPHDVPIGPAGVKILETILRGGDEEGDEVKASARGWVFSTTGKTSVSGWSKAKRRLDADVAGLGADGKALEQPAPLEAWTIHDLRRSVATHMLDHGLATLPAIERLLNHTSGSFAGIVGTYQRGELWSEQTQAVEAWARLVIPGAGKGPQLRVVA